MATNAIAQIEVPRSTVRIEAFGAWGYRYGPSDQLTAILIPLDGSNSPGKSLENLVATDVPYGTYRLTVYSSSGSVGQRQVVVSAPQLWVYIGLSFPHGDRDWPGGGLSFHGFVSNTQANEFDGHWWVKIHGLYLEIAREAPINRQGQFIVDGLEPGTYVIEIFDGLKLRHAFTEEIDGNEPDRDIRITLPVEAAH